MAVKTPSRLYRSRSQKMVAGVCGGLGEYFDVDPVLIRLLFVVTAFISGVGILAYIVLWVLVPVEGEAAPRFDADALRRDAARLAERVRDLLDPPARASGPAGQADAGGQADPAGKAGPAGQTEPGGQPGPTGQADSAGSTGQADQAGPADQAPR